MASFQLKLFTLPPNSISNTTANEARMSSDYKVILNSGVLSDFEFKLKNNESLKAHKVVLCARSPVFYKMFTTYMQDAKKSSIDLPDINSNTIKEFLRFIYCNEVQNLETVALELLFIAEKYQVEPLKQLCARHIETKLSEQNVLDVIVIADRMTNSKQLLRKCVSLILR